MATADWEKLKTVSEISIHVSKQKDLGEGMRRAWKYRIAVVFLLLVMLVGGTAAVSVNVMEITFVLVLAFMVVLIAFLLIASRLKKKNGRKHAQSTLARTLLNNF